MQDKWSELLESLEGEIEALTLTQIEDILHLFQRGLSGQFVARVIKGEFDYGCMNWVEWHKTLIHTLNTERE